MRWLDDDDEGPYPMIDPGLTESETGRLADALRHADYMNWPAAEVAEKLAGTVHAIVAARLPEPTHSVLQSWVMHLPLREQGTLVTAVRGCDDEPKQWTATGFADSPGRRLTAFIRWCFMHPADPREVDLPGAFMQSTPPEPFRPSEFGHLPQHWYAHVMHALEVIGYRHPDPAVQSIARRLYTAMVWNLHLVPEPRHEMVKRLSEDRIVAGTVVS